MLVDTYLSVVVESERAKDRTMETPCCTCWGLPLASSQHLEEGPPPSSAAGQVPPLNVNYARPAQHPRRLMPWALLKEAKRVYVFFIFSICQLPSSPGLFRRVAPHDRHQSAPLPPIKLWMRHQLHQRLCPPAREALPMVPWAARARTQ